MPVFIAGIFFFCYKILKFESFLFLMELVKLLFYRNDLAVLNLDPKFIFDIGRAHV